MLLRGCAVCGGRILVLVSESGYGGGNQGKHEAEEGDDCKKAATAAHGWNSPWETKSAKQAGAPYRRARTVGRYG